MLNLIKIKQILKKNYLIILIIFFAFLLRIFKLNHGYPYVYNIDEPAVIRSSLGLIFDKNIGHFDWPHLNFYLNYVIYLLFIKIRGFLQLLQLRGPLESSFPLLWNDPFVFYFLSRLFNAILSVLTIIPVYFLTKDMFSKRAGLYASAFFAVIPFLIYSSHLANQDVLMLFFVTLSVYGSYKTIYSKSLKWAMLTGIFVGLASGAKYNAVLFLISMPVFALLEVYENQKTVKGIYDMVKNNLISYFKYIFLALFVGFVVFFMTTPEIFTKWDVFWSYEAGRGFLWQLNDNSAPLSLGEYLLNIPQKIIQIQRDMGIIMGILSFLFIPLVWLRNKKYGIRLISIAIISLVFFMFTAKYGRSGSHYFIPIYGLLAIFPAVFVDVINKKLLRNIIFVSLLIIPLFFAVEKLVRFQNGYTFDDVLKQYEINENLEEKERILIYYSGESLSEVVSINNLKMKRYKDDSVINQGDVLFSEKEINSDKITQTGRIENDLRLGPVIYIYEKIDR